MRQVQVYGRPGCHLCDEALAVIRRVQERRPFALELIDIERDDELFKRYLERIPVVTVDGRELFQYFVDEAAFSAAVSIVSAP